MLPAAYRVLRTRRETKDTITLELSPAGGGQAFRFEPGQFSMIYAFGIGEAPISISGDPGRAEILTHTVRGVGAVTRAICAARRGDLFGVRGPYGRSWPMEAALASDVVIVGGGIGLAPLRPVIHRLLADRDRYARISILYGCRTPGDVLFAKEIQRLRGRFDLDVHVTVDAADPRWRGSVGPVTVLIPRAPIDPARVAAFVCGPDIMMRFVMRELERRGVSPDRMFLSAERNMKCAVGLCGHCQLGPKFVCTDGPVFASSELAPFMGIAEL
jgi:NAD(P)H-flavin reductase